MLVGNFFNYQSTCRRFSAQTAYGHATVREAKLDCVFESQWFVQMNVVVRSLQFRFL
jgi:hypothetical protein